MRFKTDLREMEDNRGSHPKLAHSCARGPFSSSLGASASCPLLAAGRASVRAERQSLNRHLEKYSLSSLSLSTMRLNSTDIFHPGPVHC